MAVIQSKGERRVSTGEQAVSAHPFVAALAGDVRPARVGIVYRLGLLLVAVTMLMLPLIYVGLIALASWFVYWHAVNDTWIMTGGGGRGGGGRVMILRVFLYLVPIFVGGVLVLFMVKPIFARRRVSQAHLTVSVLDEPLLHAFVAALARLVHAPRPKRIDVDCQVNASASFADGLVGFLRGDLVLTIGLPLVAGLDLRQLTGVLAHELGHFAQGGAMRLTYVIRGVNGWLARVAFGRDRWDDRLAAMSRDGDHWAIQGAALAAIACVAISRLILKFLTIAGHAVSSLMMRQMEFDADRYEARVAGTGAFEQTAQRLPMLGLAQHAALNDLQRAWQERRLCDDLATLIRHRDEQMPPQVRKQIADATRGAKTGWFDTHPSDADRVVSVRRENAPGVFTVDAPATRLFNDFEEVSRLATLRFYLDVLGDAVRPEHVFPTSQLIRAHGKRRTSAEACGRYFCGLLDARRPVFPPGHVKPAGDESAVAEQVLEARCDFAALAAGAAEAVERFNKADERVFSIAQAKIVRTTEAKLVHPDAALAKASDVTLRALRGEAMREWGAAEQTLKDALAPAMRRLELALSIHLGRQQRAAARAASADDAAGEYEIEDASRGSMQVLLDALGRMRAVQPAIDELRLKYHEQAALLAHVEPMENRQLLIQAVLSCTRRQHVLLLSELLAAFRDVAYPYEHAEGRVTLARFLLPHVLGPDQVDETQAAAENALEAYYDLYLRMMCDLAGVAEGVEADLGLPPLESLSAEQAQPQPQT